MFISNFNSAYLRPTGLVVQKMNASPGPVDMLDDLVFFPYDDKGDRVCLEIRINDDNKANTYRFDKPLYQGNSSKIVLHSIMAPQKFIIGGQQNDVFFHYLAQYSLDGSNWSAAQSGKLFTTNEPSALTAQTGVFFWHQFEWDHSIPSGDFTDPMVKIGATGSIPNTDNPFFWVDAIYLEVQTSQLFPLFIEGRANPNSGSIPLYESGYDSLSSSIPLYLQNDSSSSGNIPLYTFGANPINSSIPLYEYGFDYSSGQIPLFIQGAISQSGEIPLYIYGLGTENSGIPLYLLNIGEASGEIPLYTFGAYLIDSGIPLYMSGRRLDESGILPLFLKVPEPSVSSIPLFMPSIDFASGEIPLFMEGGIHLNSGIPLYLIGHNVSSRSLNLYMPAPSAQMATNSVPLYTFTSELGSGGIFQSNDEIPLFIAATGLGFSRSLDLYLEAPLIGQADRSLSLYVGADQSEESSIPLFVQNAYQGVYSGISLYVEQNRGLSPFDPEYFTLLDGFYPFSQSMSLYVRAEEGTSLPLFLKGQADLGSGQMMLYTAGSNPHSTGLNLFLRAGIINDSLDLYTHGF